MHRLIETIEESLAGIVRPEPIEIRGAWSESLRRTYRDESQAGSGAGPFAEVVDVFWRATVACAQPVAGIGFLHARTSLHWVKSKPASADVSIEIGFHAYRDRLPGRATFSSGLHGARLPGVPVECGPDPVRACTLGASRTATGRAHVVAEIDGYAFAVVLIEDELLRTGRNHLWRLRDALAADLPADVRALLTRGRSGEVRD